MGNAIQRVSPTCIPVPDSKTKEYLEKKGVIFDKPILSQYQGKDVAFMIKCKLPEGWGIICESTRGDISYYYLIDKEGKAIASIFWMCKGMYDTETRISISKEEKRLDLEKCDFDQGWYKLRKDEEREEFDHLFKEYLMMPNYGSRQPEIDRRRELLISLNKNYIGEIPILQTQDRNNDLSQAIFNSSQGGITYSQYVSEEIPWL